MSTVPKISQSTTDPSLLGRRDAFHVPGVLVQSISGGYVSPAGSKVRFIDPDCRYVDFAIGGNYDAIVDPFLKDKIAPHSLFWVFLSPDIVGNLVHSFDINRGTPEPLPKQEKEEDDGWGACYGSQSSEDEDEDDGCGGCYS